MIGRVYYDDGPNYQLCDKIGPQEFHFRLNEVKSMDENENNQETPFLTPFMIAGRGGCSFVKKVRGMEDAGAAVAVVVDNSDEDINNIVMSDDGSGAGIRIPSMLISKKDGDVLIEWMKNASDEEKSQLSMLADFTLQKKDNNHVTYDIWYTSTNDVALDFIQDFETIDRAFGSRVTMTPRVVFWECSDCDKETLEKHCFAKGSYCADSTTKLTGQEIIMEDLRQMCIYR